MEQNPTTENQETAEPVVHEVDSSYTKRDIKLSHGKSHKGLIIGIIVAVLLVCGGLAAWFCFWYNNPDQVAYEAVNQLIKAENVGFEGGFSFFNPDEDSELEMILVSFDSASSSLPNSTSGKIQFIFDPEKVEGEPRVLIEVKNIIMQDGVIYLQLAGLMDSINSLEIDEDTRASLEVYLDTIEVIDNEWWRISIPDLLAEAELPEAQTSAFGDVYQCIVQAANSDVSGEVTEIYKQNQFVKVQPSKWLAPDDSDSFEELTAGYKAYELTVDKEKLASFVNRMPETKVAEDFFACYSQAVYDAGYTNDKKSLSASDFAEITAEDIEWPDAEDMRIYLEISRFGHQLRSAHVYTYDDGEYVAGGVVLFKYDTVVVSAPESYRPITDLFTELSGMFNQMFQVESEGI